MLCAWGCSGGSGLERGVDKLAASMSYSLDGAVSASRSFDLPYDGIIDVEVDTFAGDVVLRAGRRGLDKVEVEVHVRALHGRHRKEEAEQSLGRVRVDADIVRGGDVPKLVLKASTTDGEPWLHRTDIEVLLPEMRRARVRTRSGKVYVFEGRGGVWAHTSDGDIRVITPDAITDPVTLVTRGADIVYRVGLGSCGLFDVDIVNGQVAARMEAGDWRILDRRNDHDTLYAQLGTCSSKVLMRTSDGRVTISVVKDPMDHGSWFLTP